MSPLLTHKTGHVLTHVLKSLSKEFVSAIEVGFNDTLFSILLKVETLFSVPSTGLSERAKVNKSSYWRVCMYVRTHGRI